MSDTDDKQQPLNPLDLKAELQPYLDLVEALALLRDASYAPLSEAKSNRLTSLCLTYWTRFQAALALSKLKIREVDAYIESVRTKPPTGTRPN